MADRDGILDPAFRTRVVICPMLVAGYSMAAAFEFARGAGMAERYRFMAAGLCGAHGLFYLVRAIWGPTLGFAIASTEAVVSAWGAVIALEIVLFATALATLVVAIALERSGLAERRAALTDHLTGVGNRRAFDSAMRAHLAASDDHEPAVLLLLDLDRFKEVNDRFGHEAGDDLLKAFAASISQTLPDPGLFWRLGGDEFAILVRGCEPHRVEPLKDTLRQAVNASEAFEEASAEVRVSVSIGSAAVIPGEAAADVVRRADAALYLEKSRRRRVEAMPRFYHPVAPAACAAARREPLPASRTGWLVEWTFGLAHVSYAPIFRPLRLACRWPESRHSHSRKRHIDCWTLRRSVE
jgi:diguanylate cyclase (GGDEF)-like protein